MFFSEGEIKFFLSGSREEESSCGRPLGIRVGPNGTLFVADAYLGVFEVNPTTGEPGSGKTPIPVVVEIPSTFVLCVGEATRLVSGGQVVAGRKLSFINDLAVTQDGKKLYFTSSSSRWNRRDYMQLIMEATADGRYDEQQPEAGLCWKVKHPQQHLYLFKTQNV